MRRDKDQERFFMHTWWPAIHTVLFRFCDFMETLDPEDFRIQVQCDFKSKSVFLGSDSWATNVNRGSCMCTKLNEVNVLRRISNVAGPTQFSLVRLKSTWLVEDSVYILKALAVKNAFKSCLTCYINVTSSVLLKSELKGRFVFKPKANEIN